MYLFHMHFGCIMVRFLISAAFSPDKLFIPLIIFKSILQTSKETYKHQTKIENYLI